MQKNDILNIAKTQLALDYNCLVADLEKPGVTITYNNCLERRTFTCQILMRKK